MSEQQTFVYFMATQDRSMVKIGCSSFPISRLATFSVWSPVPLEILAFVPGTFNDERALHSRYIENHSHSEWFKCTPEMLADIGAISRFGELPQRFRGSDYEPNLLVRIKQSPEARAKNEASRQKRINRERRREELTSLATKFLADHKMSHDELNALLGLRVMNRRHYDGSFYLVYEIRDHARIKAFLETYSAQARAS